MWQELDLSLIAQDEDVRLLAAEEQEDCESGEFCMSLPDFQARFALLYDCRVLQTALHGG